MGDKRLNDLLRQRELHVLVVVVVVVAAALLLVVVVVTVVVMVVAIPHRALHTNCFMKLNVRERLTPVENSAGNIISFVILLPLLPPVSFSSHCHRMTRRRRHLTSSPKYNTHK
jgi:hypothetical protein